MSFASAGGLPFEIGEVTGVILAIIAGTWKISGVLSRIEVRIARIEERIQSLDRRVAHMEREDAPSA